MQCKLHTFSLKILAENLKKIGGNLATRLPAFWMYVCFYIHFDVTIRFGVVFEGFLEFLGVGHAFRLIPSPKTCQLGPLAHFGASRWVYVLPSKYRENTSLYPKPDGKTGALLYFLSK